jgi:hypothetical protein
MNETKYIFNVKVLLESLFNKNSEAPFSKVLNYCRVFIVDGEIYCIDVCPQGFWGLLKILEYIQPENYMTKE